MQIEIKHQGLAHLARELLDNADVTSTVIAGGVAIFLSYGLWKVGRLIVRANRAIRTKLERSERPKMASTHFEAAQPVAVDTVSRLSRHWERVETFTAGKIGRAGDMRQSHRAAETVLDALDFEVANLMQDIASVSAYAAQRTGRAAPGPERLAPRQPRSRHSIAA